MQHVDLFTWLRGDILVKADKMTMANSLELRVPFLDPEVFAVASTLPRSEKVAEGTTKLALRRALDGIVPGHVLHRRKRSEEHTSELQSHVNLVCRLLLEKKKKNRC